ncbi:hypothetical protein [Kribbella sp. NPDC050459]|uniref:hypothetical protein n=1 Tax=Kribbella sp. NPDC050459 TaxID=3155785 RepID=UPI0033FBC9E0
MCRGRGPTQLGPDTIRGLMAEAPDVGPEVYGRTTGATAMIVQRGAVSSPRPTCPRGPHLWLSRGT